MKSRNDKALFKSLKKRRALCLKDKILSESRDLKRFFSCDRFIID